MRDTSRLLLPGVSVQAATGSVDQQRGTNELNSIAPFDTKRNPDRHSTIRFEHVLIQLYSESGRTRASSSERISIVLAYVLDSPVSSAATFRPTGGGSRRNDTS